MFIDSAPSSESILLMKREGVVVDGTLSTPTLASLCFSNGSGSSPRDLPSRSKFIAHRAADGTTLQVPSHQALAESRVVLPPHPENGEYLVANGQYWLPKDHELFQRPDFMPYREQLDVAPETLREAGLIFVPEALDPWVFNQRDTVPVIGRQIARRNLSTLALDPLIDPSDLNNLLFVPPSEVKRVLHELETLSREQSPDHAIALVFGYGGTIASVERLINGSPTLVAGLNSSYLIKTAGYKAENKFAVVTSQFPTLMDSSQMRGVFLRDLLILLCHIHKAGSDLLKSRFSGVIVPHGTDTLEWSAAKLAFQAGPDLPFPIIFASSQLSLNKPGADGPANILLALEIAEKLTKEHKPLVAAVMGGHKGGALFGAGLRKVSDTSVESHRADGYEKIVDSDNMAGPTLSPFLNSYASRRRAVWRPVIIRQFLERDDFSVIVSQDTTPRHVYQKIANIPLPVAHLVCFGSHTAQWASIAAALAAAKDHRKALLVSNTIPGALGIHNYQATLWLDKSDAIRLGMCPHGIEGKLSLAYELFGRSSQALPQIVSFLTGNDYIGEQLPTLAKPFESPCAAQALGTDGLDAVLPPLP